MKICVNQFNVYPKIALAGTRGSYGVDAKLEFEFGESWKDLARSVTFYPADDSGPVSVLLGDSTSLNIPCEVMNVSGQAHYVVSGSRGNEIMISVTGILQVSETLEPASSAASEPTPSVIDQLIEGVNTAKSSAESAEMKVDECLLMMEQYGFDLDIAKKCEESAMQSANSASEASRSAELACEEAENAKTLANDANTASLEALERVISAEEKLNSDIERIYANADNVKQTTSNSLKGHVSGEGSVYIDDISPIEHTLDVKVRSKNILDSANATVWTQSAGTWNERMTAERYGNGIKMTAKQAEAQSWTTGGFTLGLTKDFLGKTLTLSFGNVTFSMQSGSHKTCILFGICKHDNYYMDSQSNMINISTYTNANVLTFTIPADADYETYPYLRITFYINNGGAVSVGDYAIYEDIMVEEGAVSEPMYTPYVNVGDYSVDVWHGGYDGEYGGYPINDDGTVDGVKSGYPAMFLESVVVSGIVLDVGYNKDANKVVASLEERIAALEAAIVSK